MARNLLYQLGLAKSQPVHEEKETNTPEETYRYIMIWKGFDQNMDPSHYESANVVQKTARPKTARVKVGRITQQERGPHGTPRRVCGQRRSSRALREVPTGKGLGGTKPRALRCPFLARERNRI
ncbi:hypothetical protein JRQ81_012135, partial [Phrynocephalus forsythii]